MEQKFFERMVSCTPEKVVEMDAVELRRLMKECEAEVETEKRTVRKILLYLNMGDLCRDVHHPYWALSMYKSALRLCLDTDYENQTMYYYKHAMRAAESIRDVWAEVYPDVDKWEEIREVKACYSDLYDIIYCMD